MNRWLSLTLLFGLVSLVPAAKADEWDKRTTVTFNEPVEIPGRVLPAGTYTMRLLDNSAERDIVQFFNQDETRLVDTVMAIPDYRLEPTGKTVITFEERAGNSPEAIKDWFYPGDEYGVEFVYPKTHPALTAQSEVKPRPEPKYEATPAPAPAPKPAPAQTAVQPAPAPQQPTQMAMAKPEPAPAPEPAPTPQQETKPAAKKLPKTASELPLTASLGAIALIIGFALRRRTA